MDIAGLFPVLGAAFAVLVALAVAAYERRSLPYWLFVVGMGLFACEEAVAAAAAEAVLPEQRLYWQNWGLLILAALPAPWLGFSLTYARGDYQVSIRKWRLALLAVGLGPLGLAFAFRDRLMLLAVRAEPTYHWTFRLAPAGVALNLVFLLTSVMVLMNLERTFRASVGTMRWRIKFMILGLAMLFMVQAYASSQVLLFQTVDVILQPIKSGALVVACLLMMRSLWRAGHFKVEVYPSQSILQSSLTLLLAGIYLFIVGVLARLLAFLGGDAAFQFKAFLIFVAVAVLVVLLVSERVRWYTRGFVSLHFQRPFYDYRVVWKKFTERTAHCVEPQDLTTAVARLLSELFQAQSVSVWLADENRETLSFSASTLLSAEKARLLQLEPEEARAVIGALARRSDPVDLDASKEDWAVAARRCHPMQFPNGGNRFAVSLSAGEEWLGMITLGDHVGGAPFSFQDLDLLKSVSEQAATSLLNIRLVQRLSQAKQMEAFQAMSAFFVHDLKNTASTLSLMLQNLPVHFADPAFREDALRGVAKTVSHVNDLISRLNLLRQGLAVNLVECDLNALVGEALKGQDQAPGIKVTRDLQPLPRVRLDPTQFTKVVTNLVINAREALGAGGEISVRTCRRDAWAVLDIADTGCGMSREFIQQSLFRPFRTTKKNGMGIGMFHCRLIVEAHRGRIEVQSTPGRGTTFHVFLPVI